MTETEWLESQDPVAMLESISGLATDRKARLFACACCRWFMSVVDDRRFPKAVETAERYADGHSTKAALKCARQAVRAMRHNLPPNKADDHVQWTALWLAEVAASENAFGQVAQEIQRLCSEGVLNPNRQPPGPDLLRCLLGNPFRAAPIDPAWRTADIVALAQSIHDERTFDHLPNLAKRLKQAGCDNKDLLSHCRSRGPHALGCWVVDGLLGNI